jgi:hypothetical protein
MLGCVGVEYDLASDSDRADTLVDIAGARGADDIRMFSRKVVIGFRLENTTN